jgi:hypothetical protein
MPRLPGPKSPRPKPSLGTTRPVHVEFSDVSIRGSGSDRFVQVVVTVKTGSRRMLGDFERFASLHGLDWEHIGRDDGEGTHAEPSGTVVTTDRGERAIVNRIGNRLTMVAIPDASETTSQFLLWGHGERLAAFLEANTGNNRSVSAWTFNVPVRVAGCSGSGSLEGTVAKRVRDMVRGKAEREAREERTRRERLPLEERERIELLEGMERAAVLAR